MICQTSTTDCTVSTSSPPKSTGLDSPRYIHKCRSQIMSLHDSWHFVLEGLFFASSSHFLPVTLWRCFPKLFVQRLRPPLSSLLWLGCAPRNTSFPSVCFCLCLLVPVHLDEIFFWHQVRLPSTFSSGSSSAQCPPCQSQHPLRGFLVTHKVP